MENGTGNAYTIRLSLLQMAKDLAMEDYRGQMTISEYKYQQQSEIDRGTGKITQLELPKIPSTAQITKLAEELNKFVSKK